MSATVNEDIVTLLKELEGFRAKPYSDGTGDKAGWAIGYGHYTRLNDGESMPTDTVWTQQHAESILREDIHARDKELAAKYPWYNDLTQDQKNGILSYYFNTGRIPPILDKMMTAGNYQGAAIFLTSDNKESHQARREREAALIWNPEAENPDAAEEATDTETPKSSTQTKTDSEIDTKAETKTDIETETDIEKEEPYWSRFIPDDYGMERFFTSLNEETDQKEPVDENMKSFTVNFSKAMEQAEELINSGMYSNMAQYNKQRKPKLDVLQ